MDVLSTTKTRIDYVDLYRAIGIIFMIMGHIGFGACFDHYIDAFHVPMFFMLSGFFFNSNIDKGWMETLKYNARRLLLPYSVFAVFYFFIISIAKGFDAKIFANMLWDNTDDSLLIGGSLWFLTSLFWARIIYYSIFKISIHQFTKVVLIVLVSIFGCIVPRITHDRLPYGLDAACVGVGLMQMGVQLKKSINRIMGLRKHIIFLLFIFNFTLIYFNGYINMRKGEYAFIPLFWVNAIIAFVCWLVLSRYLDDRLPKSISQIIRYCGHNSIIFLCLNQLIIACVKECMLIIGITGITLTITTLIFTLIILYIATCVILNSGLRNLFSI